VGIVPVATSGKERERERESEREREREREKAARREVREQTRPHRGDA